MPIKYMGSKSRIAKYIVPIIQKYIDEYNPAFYLEPFVGGANVIDKINHPNKFGSDKNHSFYIVSSGKGYKLTRNRKEITEAIERDEAIARRRMARIQKRKRGLKKLNNHTLHGDGLV